MVVLKKTFFYILIIYFLLIINSDAFADGSAFKYRDNSTSSLFNENSQFCIINYKDNTQKMLINILLNDTFEEEKALWLFPIPASTNEATLDILGSVPIIKGINFEDELKTKVNKYFELFMISQIFTLPFLMRESTSTIAYSKPGIDIIQKVEKYGISSELISVKNKQDFMDYLSKHKIKFSDEFNKILDEYIGKNYIFVISWISNTKEYINNVSNSKNVKIPIEVYVTFKTPKIFFPLKFTSIYGNSFISINLYILNLVNPNIFKEILNYTKVSHLIMEEYYIPDDLKDFFFNKSYINNLKYTKIAIKAYASNYIEDLWINPNEAFLFLKALFYDYIDIIFIILFAFISCVISYITCNLSFPEAKPSIKFFLLFGFFNYLTTIGLIIASYILKIDKTLISTDSINTKSEFNKSYKVLISLYAAIFSTIPTLLISGLISTLIFENYYFSSLDIKFKQIIIIIMLLFFCLIFYINCIYIYKIFKWYLINLDILKYICNFTILFTITYYLMFKLIFFTLKI